jgi:formate hydrogenlyase transcriptional activator
VIAVPKPRERTMLPTAMTLAEFETSCIRDVLRITGWRVRGAGGAANRLGLKPTTLESLMIGLGITRHQVA